MGKISDVVTISSSSVRLGGIVDVCDCAECDVLEIDVWEEVISVFSIIGL